MSAFTLVNELLLGQLKEARHHLHKNPELSNFEYETAKYVEYYLTTYAKADQILMDVGANGVVAIFDSGVEGPSVLFRAELDALPIQEINEFEHKSTVCGVSHKCGHDGHATTLLGLAVVLSSTKPCRGRVILAWQSAEEIGTGATAMLEDQQFIDHVRELDYVFSFHNIPDYPLGAVITRKGAFTASVRGVKIVFNGSTSHAAEPENGVNPALPMAAILNTLCTEVSNNAVDREDFCVVTPVNMKLCATEDHETVEQEAQERERRMTLVMQTTPMLAPPSSSVGYGISAGYGELHVTVRTWTEREMDRLVDTINAVVERHTQHVDGLTTAISFCDVFASNENNDEAVEMVRDAAVRAAGRGVLGVDASAAAAAAAEGGGECAGEGQGLFSVVHREHPMKWGEDFGAFTQKYKGAYFGLGSGKDHPALHNADFDYPDALLEVGLLMHVGILQHSSLGML